MIRAIFFDLDDTLVDRASAHRRYCLDLLDRRPDIFRDADLEKLAGDADDPSWDRKAFSRRVALAFPGLGLTAEEVSRDHASRLSAFVDPDPEVVRLLERLASRYRLAVVSNGSSRVQRAKLARLGLGAATPRAFLSGELGVAKPDPRPFRLALEWAGCGSDESLMVGDDPVRDVAGAAGVGIADLLGLTWSGLSQRPAGARLVDRPRGRFAGGPGMINVNSLIGTHDVLLVTLDTLCATTWRGTRAGGRSDVPNLAAILLRRRAVGRSGTRPGASPTPPIMRSSPASCPRLPESGSRSGRSPRGSREARPSAKGHASWTPPKSSPACRDGGYHTACDIGGVGFFNKRSPLGSVLPALFAESHWSPELGVTDPRSTENQVALAASILGGLPSDRRAFLFLNVSAVHQPNCYYLEGAREDSIASHVAALAYVDRHLPTLFEAIRRRGPAFAILCSDHGTAYGEDGYRGHRLAHPVVWTVPYAEAILPGATP